MFCLYYGSFEEMMSDYDGCVDEFCREHSENGIKLLVGTDIHLDDADREIYNALKENDVINKTEIYAGGRAVSYLDGNEESF